MTGWRPLACGCPRPLHAPGQQRLLGAPGRDRPPGRGRRRPGAGAGVLRRAGWSPTTTGSGRGTRPSPTRPRRRPPGAAPRTAGLPRPPAAPAADGSRSSSGRLADYDTAVRHSTPTVRAATPTVDEPSPGSGSGLISPHASTTTGASQPRDVTSEVAFLTRALKAPTLREAVARLADRARAESWTHEEFLVACLQREVSARESHGGEGRIRAARFPARKSVGGVRLRPRPRPQTRHHRPPGHPGLRHRPRERRLPRPTRHRQDPPGDRAGDPGLPGRAPGPVRHRQPNGSPGSPTPTPPAGSRPSWSGSAATRCSSSTYADTATMPRGRSTREVPCVTAVGF